MGRLVALHVITLLLPAVERVRMLALRSEGARGGERLSAVPLPLLARRKSLASAPMLCSEGVSERSWMA